jgi:hypothetical protein
MTVRNRPAKFVVLVKEASGVDDDGLAGHVSVRHMATTMSARKNANSV